MQTKPGTKNEFHRTAPAEETTGFAISKDGTSIGYYRIGRGPALVLVQGAMGMAQSFMQLAESLADTFTVCVPDRRGRGLSDVPYRRDHSIQKEVEDLDALLDKTGARFVFGLSSGALISLQAALTLPTIHKAAIYEPPLFVNGAPTALLMRYEKEMAQGKVAAALITAMKAIQLGPKAFNAMPRWLLELLTNRALESEDKKAKSGDITMRMLAPTLRYDFQVVSEMTGALDSFRAVQPQILLLGGSQSPAFLKADLDALEKVLPHVMRVEFPGLGHAAAWNYDRQRNPGGQPEVVATELKRFFTQP